MRQLATRSLGPQSSRRHGAEAPENRGSTGLANRRPDAIAQRRLAEFIRSSPRAVAQAKLEAALREEPAQRAEASVARHLPHGDAEEDESRQLKQASSPLQRLDNGEDALQKQAAALPVQRMGPEDEEPLQAKAAEEEAPAQLRTEQPPAVIQLTPSDELKRLDKLTHEALTSDHFQKLDPALGRVLMNVLRQINLLKEADQDGRGMKEILELRVESAIKKISHAQRTGWIDKIEGAGLKRPKVVDKPPGAYHAAPWRWAETIATEGIKAGSSGEKGLEEPYSCFAPTAAGMAVLGGRGSVAFRVKADCLHLFSFIRWGAGGTPSNKEIRCLGNVPAWCLQCAPFAGERKWVDAQHQLSLEKQPGFKGKSLLIAPSAVKEKHEKDEALKKAKQSKFESPDKKE